MAYPLESSKISDSDTALSWSVQMKMLLIGLHDTQRCIKPQESGLVSSDIREHMKQ